MHRRKIGMKTINRFPKVTKGMSDIDCYYRVHLLFTLSI